MRLDQQMREMLETPGVHSVCLVDWRGGHILMHAGADDRATDTAEIVRAIRGGPLCAAQALEDVVVTDADHHLLFAVLEDSDLCVQVRMSSTEGNLGFALRGLRRLARTARVPPQPPQSPQPRRDSDHPPRRGRDRPRPAARVAAPVDRRVLERVVTALRSLSVDGSRSVSA
ncbi:MULTISPECIES: hypothetical protein [Nocardiopsis]|uniref:Roadblock/LAMTOR2 domain-containing protein n=1 Tax=Nocardiopsis sinuspersici TaxID=501010 RepID=A0A1V3C4C5_9ACTN|nr:MULTISPECIES: hypothetical protein [Nocardiopsis]OOC55585.1 hypothetical protein NOSIN_18590 [Nocardiopsis sinuspersici]